MPGEAVTPCPSTAPRCLGQGCPHRRGGWVMYGPGRRRINTPCQVPCILGEGAADPSESLQTSAVPASASGLNISAGAPLLGTQNVKNQRWYLCLAFQAPYRQHSAQKALQNSVSVALQAACSCLGPSLVHAHPQTPPMKIYTAYGRVCKGCVQLHSTESKEKQKIKNPSSPRDKKKKKKKVFCPGL